MAHAVDDGERLPACPICKSGPMKFGTRTQDMDILACLACGTSVTVPRTAWNYGKPPSAPSRTVSEDR
jgi:hypothetical protein